MDDPNTGFPTRTATTVRAAIGQPNSGTDESLTRKITPGTPVEPGRGVLIDCTAAGRVRLILRNDETLEFGVSPGIPVQFDRLPVKDCVIVSGAAQVTVLV